MLALRGQPTYSLRRLPFSLENLYKTLEPRNPSSPILHRCSPPTTSIVHEPNPSPLTPHNHPTRSPWICCRHRCLGWAQVDLLTSAMSKAAMDAPPLVDELACCARGQPHRLQIQMCLLPPNLIRRLGRGQPSMKQTSILFKLYYLGWAMLSHHDKKKKS